MLRPRPSLGLLLGFLLPLVLTAPGCLRTLDASLMNKNKTDASAGSGGGAGADASGGSGGTVTGGAGGTDGGAEADSGPDAPVDARPEAGFTPYDKSKHPVTDLLGASGRRLIAVDSLTVFFTNYNDPQAGLASVPVAGGQGATDVTTATLSRPQQLIAPGNSLSVYYVGATPTDNGVIGVFIKSPTGANPETQIGIGSAFGRAVGISASSDNYAYVSLRATTVGAPSLLKFSLAAGTKTAQVLLQSQKGSETGGAVTATKNCVYWINNGGVWVVKKDGSSAAATSALKNQVTDAIDITSDTSNFYYTRDTGEVWQRPLSGTACDGSGPAEKPIAWGYTNIGHVGVYNNTVVWGAQGATSTYAGGGIFTTDVGGYDVVQIAPATKGVDDVAVGPTDIVYSTLDGSVHKVPK